MATVLVADRDRHRDMTTLERAFDLARGGTCRTLDEIKRTLLAERFDCVESHLAGKSIRRELKDVMERRLGQA